MTNDSTTALDHQLNPFLVQQAMALIEPAQRIAILAHMHPDGDCLGSALGLAHILRELGKTCVPACPDPAPKSFSFLPGIETLQQTLGTVGEEPFDLVIALDAGELSRYGALSQQHQSFLNRVPILNIDHHISSDGCGQVNIINPISAATGELLVLFQQQAALPMTPNAALCLLTGIITDTGSFQYTNTTPRTMEVAALLMRAGAKPDTIIKPLFRTHPLAQLRLEAAVIAHIRTTCDGRIIWSHIDNATLNTTGATSDMDDGLSGILRDVEGVHIAILFKSYDNPDETFLSMRSTQSYNVAEICARYGGGGHARAAGARLNMPLQEAIAFVIADLEQIVCA
jgi:phosphoesterase RecJ-like protein